MQTPQSQHTQNFEAEGVNMPTEEQADYLKGKCGAYIKDEPCGQIPVRIGRVS